MGRIARAALELGFEHVLVIHGEPGMDEASPVGSTKIMEVRRGDIEEYIIHPEDLGLRRTSINDIMGGDASRNASLFMRILDGEDHPVARFIAINTALALYVGGIVKDLRDGVELVLSSLGKSTREKIEDIIRSSHN